MCHKQLQDRNAYACKLYITTNPLLLMTSCGHLHSVGSQLLTYRIHHQWPHHIIFIDHAPAWQNWKLTFNNRTNSAHTDINVETKKQLSSNLNPPHFIASTRWRWPDLRILPLWLVGDVLLLQCLWRSTIASVVPVYKLMLEFRARSLSTEM